MKNRSVDVRYVVTVFYGVKSDFVCRAMDGAALDAAAGHPHGETVGVMIAAIGTFRSRCASKLGREDDDRVVKQTALL